jgi:hypothetical protein
MTYVITLPRAGTEGAAPAATRPSSETPPGRDLPLGSPGNTAELDPVATKPRSWPGLPPHLTMDENDE